MSPRPNGARLACDTLEALGVDVVFGMPGTQNVPLFEALRTSRLRTVVATHELGAGFMANGYARASGRVGVLCTIPGPGFTYAITALAEARHDSAALLHVVVAPDEDRAHALQALDLPAMAGPVVKRVIRIEVAADVSQGVREGYLAALAGEPGPVLVMLTPEAMLGEAGPSAGDPGPPGPAGAPPGALLERLRAARRPLILAGQGAAGSASELRQLAERLQCPVATTLSGRGVLPEDHPLSMYVDMGGDGIEVLNEALESADLVLALGCKFSHNGSGGFRLRLDASRLVRVDASLASFGGSYPASLEVQADVGDVLRLILGSPHFGPTAWTTDEMAATRQRGREASRGQAEPRIAGLRPATPAALFASLRKALPREAILVTDSGLHQSLVRRHWEVLAPRGLIPPSDFQSMGFGIPAAIGANLAAPGRPVVVITGDGGFAMCGLEVLTAVREGIPIVVVVFNDGYYGLIRRQQLGEYGRTHGVVLQEPDYRGLAAAVGAGWLGAENDPCGAVAAALDLGRPALVEVGLGDSTSLDVLRARTLVRETVRRSLPSPLIRWLRRRLG